MKKAFNYAALLILPLWLPIGWSLVNSYEHSETFLGCLWNVMAWVISIEVPLIAGTLFVLCIFSGVWTQQALAKRLKAPQKDHPFYKGTILVGWLVGLIGVFLIYKLGGRFLNYLPMEIAVRMARP